MSSHGTALDLARENMIEQQIRPWEVLDTRVLNVFRQIARDAFVPTAYRGVAYTDVEIPLAHGEYMMKPVLEGRLLQSLELTGSERVLEIGTGSGFLTACLAQLAGDVVSVERHEDLAAAARRRLDDYGVTGVDVQVADALGSFAPDGKFDAIAVTGAVDTLPARFADWLKVGGRVFVVHGRSPIMEAVLVRRVDGSHLHTDSLFETDLPYLHGAAPSQRFVL